MKKFAIALIILIIIFAVQVTSIGFSNSYVENNIYVDDAGDIISITIINVTSAPSIISIPTSSQPNAYFAYYVSNNQEMPIEYNGTYLNVLANNTGLLNITYLSLTATSKNGSLWTLNLIENCNSKIYLPQNSITIYVNPSPISVYYYSNTPVLLMPQGKIIIQYVISTQLTAPTKKSYYNYTIYYVVIIAAIILLSIFIIIKKIRNKKNKIERGEEYYLDERDRTIINAIKKLGGTATANQIINETGIPKTPLYRRLSKLVQYGYIEEIITGKTKAYKIKEK
ncbi:MAG: helix-turn-helix transcriptional regulator [Caldisphaera sp.]|jgi:uncharacterized membrane protein